MRTVEDFLKEFEAETQHTFHGWRRDHIIAAIQSLIDEHVKAAVEAK